MAQIWVVGSGPSVYGNREKNTGETNPTPIWIFVILMKYGNEKNPTPTLILMRRRRN